MEKINLELQANTKEAQKNVDDLNKKVKDTGKTARKTGKDLSAGMQIGNEAVRALDRYTGGLASKFLAVGKAAKLSGKAMKTALISSGIGILVVALGLVVEYWDEITGLVDGVSSEQKEILETTQKTLDVQEKQLKSYDQMENTLKLQGKSEKEIRDIKRQKTNEIITQTELLLEQQKSQKKSQLEAAERNKKITMGIIAFLNAPIVAILGLIDGISVAMAKLGIIDEATNLAAGYVEGFAEMLFDPEEVEKKGDETIAETETKLRQLKNKRDGYLQQDKADAKKNADEKAQDEIDAEKAKAAALESIRKALIDTEDEERAEKLRKIGEDYDEQIRLAEEYYGKESEKVLELRAARKLAIDEQQAVFDEQDAAKEKADLDYWANESDKRLKKDKEISDAAIKIAEEEFKAKQTSLNGYAGALQTIGGVLGEETAAGKSLAIASSLINTYASITGTLKAFSGVPVPGYAIAQAIATGVAGFAQIKKIASVKVPSGRGGGSSVPSGGGGGSAPATESLPPAFNIVGASGTNQLADAIGGQTQQPTKAYVVASDVSTAQEMDRNIIEGASIG